MPARAAAAGRPRAPVPARLAVRGRSDARTAAAPRPPSERLVRRQHDFCLQAGFPPGHDGRGTPASSGPNVSGVPGGRAVVRAFSPRPRPGGRCQVASLKPRGGRGERGGSSAPGTRVETRDQPPPLGFGAGAGLGEEGECPDRPGGAGTGVRNGVRGAGQPGQRGTASGARCPRVWAGGRPAGRGVPGWRARVHARAIGIAGLLEPGWPV